jgi:acetyltransferase-like isoleucine patch superfamily enzyme
MRQAFGRLRRALARGTGSAVAGAAEVAAARGLLHWPFLSEALSLIPFAFGWQLRYEVYRRLTAGCGAETVLHHGVTVEDRRSRIGADVWISSGAYLDYVLIDDHVLIGQKAVLLAGRHHHHTDRLDVPIKSQGNPDKRPLRIGLGAWIGANATVMADVGQHAVVGAGAVVVDAVPDYAIVAGNPARIIRDRRSGARLKEASR